MNNQGILKIADFGLARPYGSPLRNYTQLVVTLWYRAPELLLGTKIYSAAIDVWSIGIIFGELLLSHCPLQGKNEIEQVNLIVKLLGAPNEREWPGLNDLPHTKKFSFSRAKPGDSFRVVFADKNRLSEPGLDLMRRLLHYNPQKRSTAGQALQHPYFGESPLPKETYLMPTWPSRADGGRKKKDAVAATKPTDAAQLSPQLDAAAELERQRDREALLGQDDRDYSKGFVLNPIQTRRGR